MGVRLLLLPNASLAPPTSYCDVGTVFSFVSVNNFTNTEHLMFYCLHAMYFLYVLFLVERTSNDVRSELAVAFAIHSQYLHIIRQGSFTQ